MEYVLKVWIIGVWNMFLRLGSLGVEYVFKVGIIGVWNMILRLGSLECGICF